MKHKQRIEEHFNDLYDTKGIPEKLKQPLSFMRQWLNEDRKCEPQVTTQELWKWLKDDIQKQFTEIEEEKLKEIEHNIRACISSQPYMSLIHYIDGSTIFQEKFTKEIKGTFTNLTKEK